MSSPMKAITKVAVLLMSLDSKSPGISKNIFSELGEEKSRDILKEISRLGKVDSSVIDDVTEEFFSMAIKQDVLLGGKHLSQKYLKDNFGIEDSENYFSQKEGLFDFFEQLSDKQILQFLKVESFQVIAALASFMPDTRSAKLLESFPVEHTAKISAMMLSLNVPNYSYMWKFHKRLKKQLLGQESADLPESQKLFKLSRVLEMMVADRREKVMDEISKRDTVAAEQIKQMVFSFEALLYMSDKDIQTVVVEIEPITKLAVAMQGISGQLEEKLRSNVSERLKPRLDEAISNNVASTDDEIQDVQSEIVLLCRDLERQDRISPLSDVIKERMKQESGGQHEL